MNHVPVSPQPPMSFGAWLRHDYILDGLADVEPGGRVLEVGPGKGAMGARLAQAFDYVGVEVDPVSREETRRLVEPHGGRVVASLDEVAGPFDAVCAFEVLEHLEQDEEWLATWTGLLSPGGRLVLSVPADPRRMGSWDESVGHFRRYSNRGMRQRLAAAGLEVVALHRLGFPVGYATEWVRNRVAARRPDTSGMDMEARTGRSGRLLQPSAWGAVAMMYGSWPQRALTRWLEPTNLGTGMVAIARRP